MKLFKIGKLQIKVLRTMLLASLVPLLALSVLAVFSLNYFHQQDLRLIEGTLLESTSLRIDSNLNNFLETFQPIAPQISEIPLEFQQLLLQQSLLLFSDIEEVSLIAAIGPDYGKETSLLRRGQQFAPEADLINQSQTEKFIKAVNRENYISPVYYTLSGPMVTIAVPVKNSPKSGQPAVLSVLTSELKLTDLELVLSGMRLGNSGYVYLVDKEGYLLADSRGNQKVGTFILTTASDKLSTYESFWGQQVAGKSKELSKLAATLVVEWPVEDASRIVNVTLMQIMGVSLLILVLSLFLGSFLSYKILKPIKILQAATSDVALGKLDKYIKIATNDELEQLGESFNKMIDGLKRLRELREEFVFIASHELKTPVTAIKGYLSMVLDGEAGEISLDAKTYLSEVKAANNRLIRLVEDLLQVARSEAGRLVIEVKPVDIGDSVQAVINELKPLADEKGISLSYQSENMPLVLADVDRLKEVLVNLIGNAIKYTKGSGSVSISHELSDNALITNIADTGIGMNDEEMQKLFEKFYRVKNEDTKNIQGTGLGLFIVKQIIEKMNGTIFVQSEKGRGSTLSFSLKLAN